jgi:hypothetical protein
MTPDASSSALAFLNQFVRLAGCAVPFIEQSATNLAIFGVFLPYGKFSQRDFINRAALLAGL